MREIEVNWPVSVNQKDSGNNILREKSKGRGKRNLESNSRDSQEGDELFHISSEDMYVLRDSTNSSTDVIIDCCKIAPFFNPHLLVPVLQRVPSPMFNRLQYSLISCGGDILTNIHMRVRTHTHTHTHITVSRRYALAYLFIIYLESWQTQSIDILVGKQHRLIANTSRPDLILCLSHTHAFDTQHLWNRTAPVLVWNHSFTWFSLYFILYLYVSFVFYCKSEFLVFRIIHAMIS